MSRLGYTQAFRLSVDYLARTADGRLLFGSRGSPYRYGSRIDRASDRDQAVDRKLRRVVAEWFPALREIRFSHGWGGPIGVPRDWMPTASYDPAASVASARGYSGRGVAAANLAGRILAGLITGEDSPLHRLAVVGHRSPDWEPEPLRWLGVTCSGRWSGSTGERPLRGSRPRAAASPSA